MRVVEINGGVFGSTGKMMFRIADMLIESGNEVFCASPVTATNRHREPDHDYYKIGSYFSRCLCVVIDRLTGLEGTSAVFQTGLLLRKISRFHPDIIHLHSIHGSYINIPMLFSYMKSRNIKLIWTLHDCWSFTGHCPHYEYIACTKWMEGCSGCKLYKEYPKSFFDNSKYMWRKKRKWFTGMNDTILVTPSTWLSNQVKSSFLNEYECRVINNGIDLSVFHPVESDFKSRNNITDKYMVLGVAFGWGYAKGLDAFVYLAKKLPSKYKVVLVGTDSAIDAQLPSNIISIHMTQNQKELAEIYSAADLFVNATRQDTFPTVNIEALACGTPVLTFNAGGSAEILDEKCGVVVPKDDMAGLYRKVIEICERKPFTPEACAGRANRLYNQNIKYADYLSLYKEVVD